jgi:hypothetical protein
MVPRYQYIRMEAKKNLGVSNEQQKQLVRHSAYALVSADKLNSTSFTEERVAECLRQRLFLTDPVCMTLSHVT